MHFPTKLNAIKIQKLLNSFLFYLLFIAWFTEYHAIDSRSGLCPFTSRGSVVRTDIQFRPGRNPIHRLGSFKFGHPTRPDQMESLWKEIERLNLGHILYLEAETWKLLFVSWSQTGARASGQTCTPPPEAWSMAKFRTKDVRLSVKKITLFLA